MICNDCLRDIGHLTIEKHICPVREIVSNETASILLARIDEYLLRILEHKSRIKELEDALRFYASNNWNDPNQVGSKNSTTACIRDEGKRARKALGEK